jgi:hypothetical protein
MPAPSFRRRFGCRRHDDVRSLNGTDQSLLRRPPWLPAAAHHPDREEADMKIGDRDDLPCFRNHLEAA